LNRKTILTLVHAFVCSRIDFCNGALFGISGYLVDRIQAILNATARLVLKIPKYDHISAAIRDDLHWLPVEKRIMFKTCLMVRASLTGMAPSYLQELCVPVARCPGRSQLRSSDRVDLIVPRFKTTRFGRRGFSVAGPQSWNTLPIPIRQLYGQPEQFKRALKTHLFRQ
jgi:hypothetical protein